MSRVVSSSVLPRLVPPFLQLIVILRNIGLCEFVESPRTPSRQIGPYCGRLSRLARRSIDSCCGILVECDHTMRTNSAMLRLMSALVFVPCWMGNGQSWPGCGSHIDMIWRSLSGACRTRMVDTRPRSWTSFLRRMVLHTLRGDHIRSPAKRLRSGSRSFGDLLETEGR